MSKDILIAAALSIPISLATGLLVAPIQRWMATTNASERDRRKKALKLQYDFVVACVENPAVCVEFLTHAAICTILGATCAVLGGIVCATAISLDIAKLSLSSFAGKYASIAIVVATLPLSFFAGMWLRQGFDAMVTYRRVSGFLKYCKSIPAELRDREAEWNAIRSRFRIQESKKSASESETPTTK